MTATKQIVVMGPSGSGKSLVGALLAAQLGVAFIDADDLHPAANVAKMAAGSPLTDEDRMPWLDVVGAALRAAPDGVVIACSALARRYRDRLRLHTPDAVVVELLTDPKALAERMAARDHFMPQSLLGSQLLTLEHLGDDERGIAVVTDETPARIVAVVTDALVGPQLLR